MNVFSHPTASLDLLDEIGFSFATLDDDAPRETVATCPCCRGVVTVVKNQRSGEWEMGCCGHERSNQNRTNAVQQWNTWAANQ